MAKRRIVRGSTKPWTKEDDDKLLGNLLTPSNMPADPCEKMKWHLKSEFWLGLVDDAEEYAGEHRLSHYNVVHDWDYVSGIVDDTVELYTGNDEMRLCGYDEREDMHEELSDVLEGYWNQLLREGKLEKFSRKVEEL